MRWDSEALCRHEHGAAFEKLPRVEQIGVCHRCPVRAECLADAINIEAKLPCKPSGVRGGLAGETRARLVNKVRNARKVRA